VARRIVDVAADKEQWKGFLASTDLQNAPPGSDAVRERIASPKHLLRENSPGKGERPPSPTEDANPNKDQDMHAKENSRVMEALKTCLRAMMNPNPPLKKE
jgi:hypothetical protein